MLALDGAISKKLEDTCCTTCTIITALQWHESFYLLREDCNLETKNDKEKRKLFSLVVRLAWLCDLLKINLQQHAKKLLF